MLEEWEEEGQVVRQLFVTDSDCIVERGNGLDPGSIDEAGLLVCLCKKVLPPEVCAVVVPVVGNKAVFKSFMFAWKFFLLVLVSWHTARFGISVFEALCRKLAAYCAVQGCTIGIMFLLKFHGVPHSLALLGSQVVGNFVAWKFLAFFEVEPAQSHAFTDYMEERPPVMSNSGHSWMDPGTFLIAATSVGTFASVGRWAFQRTASKVVDYS